jgi:hypothetical protein
MGYAVNEGKLVTVDDVPVSKAYVALEYWGGEKQHRRWHLAALVTLNPSRNGNPFFMDENMVAFGARWKDPTKMEAGLLELCEIMAEGVKQSGVIAKVLAMELHPH